MNTLSPELIAQIFAQESEDPFLVLVTITHEDFPEPFYLVNNSETITSRGITYNPFPMRIVLAADDGESLKDYRIEFDNVSLELIESLRSVTGPINISMEMVLASLPNEVQMSQYDLKITNITYNAHLITAIIVLDNFLNTEVTSERYEPSNFPGIF